MKQRIRFHLAKGKDFMKWQVKDVNSKKFYEPKGFRAILVGAKLVNQKGTAQKIFAGQNKTVCAWVEFDDFIILPMGERQDVSNAKFIRFNPKECPNWIDEYGNNIDGFMFNHIYVINEKLYVI